jgi:hypothetical protein
VGRRDTNRDGEEPAPGEVVVLGGAAIVHGPAGAIERCIARSLLGDVSAMVPRPKAWKLSGSRHEKGQHERAEASGR